VLAALGSFPQTRAVPTAEIDQLRLNAALEKATAELLAQRNPQGFWEGELSSSALSTATAITALAVVQRESQVSDFKSQIAAGLDWLARNQNSDGGWGDTTKSLSNISTTTLCWAAFGAAGADSKFPAAIRNAERWLTERAGSIAPDALARTIIKRYGKDRTFSVPILTLCALAGRLGSGHEAWRHVIALPFELAACPHQLFAALRLPVVSYALPALIAIGLARHVHAPSRNPFARMLRAMTREKTLRVLTKIQPANGGFLEATPLTSFVTMSLAGSGLSNHIVTQKGAEFLQRSQRPYGSWPIDTNLATWCSTLVIDALPLSSISQLQSSIPWLLNQQYRAEHPYTHAAPGGWAWTDLPGGVPDADDTSGALIALAKLRNAENGVRNDDITRAAFAGIFWLLDLQNRDGGIPTFCRGWGALPFDRSSADITAHAVRAWLAWINDAPENLRGRIRRSMTRAIEFLAKAQRSDGAWVPLWFGNQFAPNEENPVYGTARVLCALREFTKAQFEWANGAVIRALPSTAQGKGIDWLLRAQNADGSWGRGDADSGSIEETALAVQTLAELLSPGPVLGDVAAIQSAVHRGTDWLLYRIESDTWREPSPIGFYFAKLWYYERLYPLIFTVAALRSVADLSPDFALFRNRG
jgi:squalene-hopene/tetraprenyl-beta-curcumene cyclase